MYIFELHVSNVLLSSKSSIEWTASGPWKNDQNELELFPNKIECEVEFLLIAILKYLGRSDKLTTIIEFSVVCVHPSLQYLTYLGSASPKSLSAWICRFVSHLSNWSNSRSSLLTLGRLSNSYFYLFILVLDSCGVKLSSDGERPCQGKQLSFSQLSYNFKPVKQEQYSIFDNFLS